jgi:hypothetical protein
MFDIYEYRTDGEKYLYNREAYHIVPLRIREIRPTVRSCVKARVQGDFEKMRRVSMSLAPMLLPHAIFDIRKLFEEVERELGYVSFPR